MKNKKGEKLNLIFSAFLVIGFVVCSYFFSSLGAKLSATTPWLSIVIQILIPLLFGLILFYATRVGEGKPVKRFSLAVLLMVDIPALYIILATFISVFPLNSFLSAQTIVFTLAAIALGYGIPYTFLSGFELTKETEDEDDDEYDDDDEEEYEEDDEDDDEADDDADDDAEEAKPPVKGGILEELQAADEEEETDDDADAESEE